MELVPLEAETFAKVGLSVVRMGANITEKVILLAANVIRFVDRKTVRSNPTPVERIREHPSTQLLPFFGRLRVGTKVHHGEARAVL